MSTLSIQIQNGFKAKTWGSFGIRNVLLKTESMSTLSIQGGLSRKSSIPDERILSTLSIQVHLVFEMFYSKQREILKKGHPEWRVVVDTGSSGIRNVLLKTERNIKERSSGMKGCRHCRYRFIRYWRFSTQTTNTSINSVDKHSIQCNALILYRQCQQTRYHTQYTIALLWSFVLTFSTCPLMYTQQIRWQ